MRIIAGAHRGRRLLPPANDATRPITDRVKQSVFDILSPRIEGASVYDCFAGTGSMGLECLSRGAKTAMFFEADRSAAKLLKQNIASLGVADQSTIVIGDLFKWFDASGPSPLADLIFLDPPYRMLRENADALRKLAQRLGERLSPEGIVIFRHDAADELELPPLRALDRRAYGGMKLELLQASNAGASGEYDVMGS